MDDTIRYRYSVSPQEVLLDGQQRMFMAALKEDLNKGPDTDLQE